MKKIFIFKTGSTFPYIEEKWGDFDDFAIREARLKKDEVIVIDNFETENFGQIKLASGVIITGSHSNVTEETDWMKNLSKWIIQLYESDIPVLGICFGHQMLGWALGGSVGLNPKGIDVGSVEINLNQKASTDILFENFAEKFPGQMSHKQSILKLPDNSTLLASSESEPNQAICFKKGQIWGLQFHPEFNADITRLYVEAQKDSIIEDGFDF
ncbi:glutamine amidotransferase, partial [Bacteroidota bacterium]